MEQTERDIIKRFLANVNIESMPEREPEEKSNFPCNTCGGTGWVKVIQDGYTKMMRCPDCAAARKTAEIVKASGINLNDYKRFTLDRFIISDEVTRMMKETAVKFLNERTKGKGLGFFGRSGTGKTHICVAVLMAMNEEHRYWKYRHEIQKLKNAMYRDYEKYEQLVNLATTAKNLYIDDFLQGAITADGIDKQDAQIMFDIIDTRYVNHMETFFSSNATLSEINEANEPLASRIYEMTAPYIVEIKPTEAMNQRYFK